MLISINKSVQQPPRVLSARIRAFSLHKVIVAAVIFIGWQVFQRDNLQQPRRAMPLHCPLGRL
jgi:hypothetical protein